MTKTKRKPTLAEIDLSQKLKALLPNQPDTEVIDLANLAKSILAIPPYADAKAIQTTIDRIIHHRRSGRPTQYDPSYCDALIRHQAMGHSYTSFAAVVGVNAATLNAWTEKHHEFAEAREIAKAVNLLVMEAIGINGLDKGKQFNAILYMVLMRNMHGWSDLRSQTTVSGGDKAIEVSIKRGVDAALPPGASAGSLTMDAAIDITPSHDDDTDTDTDADTDDDTSSNTEKYSQLSATKECHGNRE